MTADPRKPDAPDEFEGLSHEEAGEQRFVHGLLRFAMGGKADRAKALASSAVKATQDFDPPLRTSRPFARRGLFIAATAAAAALIIWLLPDTRNPDGDPDGQSRTPRAVLRSLIDSFDAPTDRRYEIKPTYSHPRLGEFFPRGAELYIGSGGRFTVHAKSGFFELWMGYDGEEWWLVPPMPGMPVVVADRLPQGPPRAGGRRGSFMDPSLFFEAADLFHIGGVLKLMENDYRLEWMDDPEVGEDEIAIRGELILTGTRLPTTVELEAGVDDGTIRKLTLRWDETLSDFTPASLEAKEVEATPRPENWYRHEAHHEPGVPVRRFEPR